MKILQRLAGTILFRPVVYRDILENANLAESALVVTVLAFFSSLWHTWFHGLGIQSLTYLMAPPINLLLQSYLSSMLLKRLYQLDIPALKLLRIFGYATIFAALGYLVTLFNIATFPLATYLSIALTLLYIIALIIGIREAGQISIRNAIYVFFISYLTLALIYWIMRLLFGNIV